jgi:hypothetical protein
MPTVRWICPLSVALTVSANLALCSGAWSAELPVKVNHATPEPRPSGRLCTDMNGKKFRWSWANVPFASVCSDDEKDAKPSPPLRQPPQ